MKHTFTNIVKARISVPATTTSYLMDEGNITDCPEIIGIQYVP